jgi:hypothetical protein
VHSRGSVAGANCIDPSAHKGRGPQDGSVGGGREGAGVGGDAVVFRAFVKAGERLAEIHVDYEKQDQYPLAKTEKAGEKLGLARLQKCPLDSPDEASGPTWVSPGPFDFAQGRLARATSPHTSLVVPGSNHPRVRTGDVPGLSSKLSFGAPVI